MYKSTRRFGRVFVKPVV